MRIPHATIMQLDIPNVVSYAVFLYDGKITFVTYANREEEQENKRICQTANLVYLRMGNPQSTPQCYIYYVGRVSDKADQIVWLESGTVRTEITRENDLPPTSF